ncbi:MAG: hypothetical protein K2Q26_05120 [Bdellovibrionales bacterium]|nr:hypothetical protein [Bdellovibrionales bacterium]
MKQVVVGVSEAFFPSSFDSKADPMVIVNGYFPNGCYRLNSVKVTHLQEKLHEVQVLADVMQTFCTMALVPYQKVVSLGALAPGAHKVRFVAGDGTYFEKNLMIE